MNALSTTPPVFSDVMAARATDDDTLTRVLFGLRLSLTADCEVPEAIHPGNDLYEDLESVLGDHVESGLHTRPTAPATTLDVETASRVGGRLWLALHNLVRNIPETKAPQAARTHFPRPPDPTDAGHLRRLALAVLDLLDQVERHVP